MTKISEQQVKKRITATGASAINTTFYTQATATTNSQAIQAMAAQTTQHGE